MTTYASRRRAGDDDGAGSWGERPAIEAIAAVADALAWPRTRPVRLVGGDRAEVVGGLLIVGDDREVATLDAPADRAVLLAMPATAAPRGGRRASDALVVRGGEADGDPSAWREHERVVLDASDLLAGGSGGFDDRLVTALGLDPVGCRPLAPVDAGELKLVGFVPVDALPAVRSAVFAVGAGEVGDYTECSWSTPGTGTFRGGADSTPAVGTAGEFTEVAEVRWETVVPADRVDAVVRAFVDAMPYEEPAYDLVPLRTPASRVGVGRLAWGDAGIAPLLERLRDAVGVTDVERVADVAQVDADVLVAVTSGAVTPVLAHLLAAAADEALALVVATGATTAERELLAERGVMLAIVARDRVVSTYGDAIAASLSRELRLPVARAASLSFPTTGGATATAAAAAPTVERVEDTRDADGDGDDDAGDIFAQAAATGVPSSGKVPSRMWFDGGSRGNPGPAAAAFVLYDNAGVLVEADGMYLGRATNNVAEYTGLINGVRRAKELGATRIEVFGDSQLIVKQVRGEYTVKHPDMKPLHATAIGLLKSFPSGFQITHVLRGGNAEADAMVNQTLDAHGR